MYGGTARPAAWPRAAGPRGTAADRDRITRHDDMISLSPYVYLSLYLYIYIYILSVYMTYDTGVCEKTPVGRAPALQHSSRNCSPAPDLVFCRLTFPQVFSSRGVFFFTDTGMT